MQLQSALINPVFVVVLLMNSVLFFTEAQFIPNKQLQPKETQIYIKLVKYAMQALDIYQVPPLTRLSGRDVSQKHS